MKKTTIVKGTSILGVLVLIVSLYANMYRPKFPVENVEFSINVAEKTFQTIHGDKKCGVTKLINAKFHVYEPEEGDTVFINKIELKTFKLSGLLNHGFTGVKYIKTFNPDAPDYILITMSLFGDRTDVIDFKDTPLKINKHENGKIETIIIYDWFSTSSVLNNNDYEFLDKNNSKKLNEIIKIFNEQGRICNGNCIHE